MKRILLIPVLVATLLPFQSFSAEDTGLWAIASPKRPLSEAWSGSLSAQARFNNDFGTLERTVLRPSLDYRVSDRFTLTAGYDAHFIQSPDDILEQRLWQQTTWRTPLAGIAFTGRLRLEQRFIENVDGAAVRLRIYARAQKPLKESLWYLAATNEIAFNLNTLESGPRSGFNQNRFFAGIGRNLSATSRAEIGYQMQYVNLSIADITIHQVLINIRF